jgi:hypothetical protein
LFIQFICLYLCQQNETTMKALVKKIGNEYTRRNFYTDGKDKDCITIESTFGIISGQFSWSPEGVDFYNFEFADEEGNLLEIDFIDVNGTKIADEIEIFHNEEYNRLY